MAETPRVASLVPSATETAFAVGGGEAVVARTFECDHPPAARDLPVLVEGRLDEGMDSRAIDEAVQEAAREREPLHHLDVDRLVELAPDVLLTQEVCEVCAAGTPAAQRAREALDGDVEVVTLSGATLDGVLEDVLTVGKVVGRPGEAEDLVADLRTRIRAVEEAVEGVERPRVATLEWLDPPIRSGHWIPELVERAGGEPVLSEPGDHGERIGWDRVASAEPDVVVATPCGFGLDRAAREAAEAVDGLPGDVEVVAVDGDACVSRPGPRLVEGIEALGAALHPDRVEDRRPGRWRRVVG